MEGGLGVLPRKILKMKKARDISGHFVGQFYSKCRTLDYIAPIYILCRKISKTKKAGEALSVHYVGAILPSVNEEFQRILHPFMLSALFKHNASNVCGYRNHRHLHLKISTCHLS